MPLVIICIRNELKLKYSLKYDKNRFKLLQVKCANCGVAHAGNLKCCSACKKAESESTTTKRF